MIEVSLIIGPESVLNRGCLFRHSRLPLLPKLELLGLVACVRDGLLIWRVSLELGQLGSLFRKIRLMGSCHIQPKMVLRVLLEVVQVFELRLIMILPMLL